MHIEVTGRRRGRNLEIDIFANGGVMFMTVTISILTARGPCEITVVAFEIIVAGLDTRAMRRLL
jgi:hypothetical protein